MADRELGEGGNFLMSDEREFLAGDIPALAARAHVSQAAGKLALELGLPSEAGQSFVDAFRTRVAAETDGQLTAAAEIGSAIDRLREVVMKYGGATLAIAARAESLDELAAAATDQEVDATTHRDGGAPDSEVMADEPQAIQLNKRARAYLETIFGDISGLDLQEDDKLTIAKTINDLRGEGGSRALGDLTMQVQLLLAGLKDAEIGEHVHKLPGSVATGFSMAMKRIKAQPGYSAENARMTLIAKLEAHKVREDAIVDEMPSIVEEEAEVSEEQEVLAPQPWQLKETVQTGKLQGAIRLQLRKAQHDHMIELGEGRLQELITQVFDQNDAPSELRGAYERYLSTGVPEFGNEELRAYINEMPHLIAAVLTAPVETSNVLPITTPTHHHPAPRVTPAVMPRKQSVLSFAAPQKQAQLAEDAKVVASRHDHEAREVPALVAAAYNENAMSSEAWHKTAYTFITEEVPAKLGLSEHEAQGLWAAVHFSKGDTHKLRPPETKAALHALQAAMEEASEDTWKYYPELQACLRKLLNPFPPQSLGAIQRSLQARDKTVSGQAAQRHVVAAIYELTKDRYGEATA